MKKEKINNNVPLYMTPKQCAEICCFKGTEAIRRAVARGELPGTLLQPNRLLIPTEAFWTWFHRNDVIPKEPKEVALSALAPIETPEEAA